MHLMHPKYCQITIRSSVFYMALQGAVWVMEFSICGRLLATAGQDSVVVSDWSFGRLCVVIKGIVLLACRGCGC